MSELTRLGKYEIWRELGRGAMGIVYEAFDPLIQRTVAIKTILKSSFDKSEAAEAFSRFRREAQAAGRLTHPKIVSIYEYGEDEEMAYIVMELIRGKELKEYFDREERFSVKESLRIVLQLLDALDYSHSRGVVHRDIKPGNILITEDGQVKVADFGIAKIESAHLTQVGIVLGTPTYMSPEQFMGKSVDRRTDIYSTGVVLYQFLTGTRPFTGSVISIMHKAVNQEAVPPSQLNPAVPQILDAVVKKAMAKRPEDRYQTAAEFMAALKLASDNLPSEDANKPLLPADKMFSPSVSIVAPADAAEVQEHKEAEHRRLVDAEETRIKAKDRHRKEEKEKEKEKAHLARKISELRREAAETKVRANLLRKKNAEELARRAAELAGAMAEKERKLAEVVAEREAERETQRQLEVEARQKLEARIRRKKEAEEAQERREREFAEAKARANLDAKRKLAEEERIRRENEYLEARARGEAIRKQEEAEQSRRARTRIMAIAAGTAIIIAAITIWYVMRASV